MAGPSSYMFVAAILFLIGAVGVVVRRDLIVILMAVEIMLKRRESSVPRVRKAVRPERRAGFCFYGHGGCGRRGGYRACFCPFAVPYKEND